jgi:hypothetical protein
MVQEPGAGLMNMLKLKAGWFYNKATGTVCSKEDVKTDDIVLKYNGDSANDKGDEAAPAMGIKLDLVLLSGGLHRRTVSVIIAMVTMEISPHKPSDLLPLQAMQWELLQKMINQGAANRLPQHLLHWWPTEAAEYPLLPQMQCPLRGFHWWIQLTLLSHCCPLGLSFVS